MKFCRAPPQELPSGEALQPKGPELIRVVVAVIPSSRQYGSPNGTEVMRFLTSSWSTGGHVECARSFGLECAPGT